MNYLQMQKGDGYGGFKDIDNVISCATNLKKTNTLADSINFPPEGEFQRLFLKAR